MKKTRGFVIIETVVVSVFIMTMITFIYLSVKPLLGHIESQDKYNTPLALYYTDEIRNMLLHINRTGQYNISNNRNIYLSPKRFCSQAGNYKKLCDALLENKTDVQIDGIMITNYNILSLKNNILSGRTLGNRVIDDYILYARTNKDNTNKYDYRIFIVFKDQSVGELEVRYHE